ncbi:SCP2 sterol-binding domain-containing protein [Micromonospora sp. NPDC126480]|uniref:SCP2 sterol-binding domain-containing protein n=1 Tax=Micromonospora sp. NPDC126480 TaxID=3155312 RepID=UPI00332B6AF6
MTGGERDKSAGPDRWEIVRGALLEAGHRFADLVLVASDRDTKATAHWTARETAAHVGSIAWLYTSMLAGVPAPVPGFAERSRSTTVDTIAELNTLLLRHFTEREPHALAARLRTDIARILDITEGRGSASVTWLGDSRVPVAGVLAHLLNEILIHGRDIARCSGRRWEISPRDTALFLDLFVVGMLRADYGRLLDNDEPPRDRPVTVEIRSTYTAPVTLVLHRGRVVVVEPGSVPDVIVSADPTAFNLMMFGRITKLRALLTGKVRVRGRRPWVLPAFLRTVRMPN